MIAANLRPRRAIPAFIALVLALALALPAVASAAEFSLTIEEPGTGTGTVECEVESEPAEACAEEYEEGTELAVVAEADPGSDFVEFSGDCGPLECELTMDEDHTAVVLFEAEEAEVFPLTVETFGTGTVECEVESEPAEACAEEYPEGTELSLIAEAEEGSEFAEWAEDCSGTGPCELTMDEEHSVTAIFELEPKDFVLNIEELGTGTGTVECEAQEGLEPCAEEYPEGTELIVLATADPGSEFVEFGGDCEPAECELTMDEEHTVSVLFEAEGGGEPSLTITKAGTGAGTVECEVEAGPAEPCEAKYPEGTELGLVATANPGSTFAGFSAGAGSAAGCSTSPCTFTLEANSKVTATFNLSAKPKFKLTVTKSGTGTGTVTSTPAGISCGATCEAEFEEGKEVELSQSATAGSKFVEWTGACSGSGTCKVTMSAAKSVGAKFDLKPKFKLTVTKSGTGTGTVTSTPAGISCGATCEAEFEEGKEVELTQAATAGSEFKEWTGACSGSGTCKVTMSAAKTVGAKFDLTAKPKFKLTVTKSGTGTGTVTSTPAGISCGATCSAEFEEGKEVTLSQAAAAGSEFKEWTGACSGSGTCKVTMSAAKTVGAKFDTQSGGGGGGGGSTPGTAKAAPTASVSSGKAALVISCSGGPCSGTLKLTAKVKQGKKKKNLIIGTASFSLAAGASTTIKVKLSGPAKQELAKGKTIKANVTGTGIASSTVKLKAAKKKKKK